VTKASDMKPNLVDQTRELLNGRKLTVYTTIQNSSAIIFPLAHYVVKWSLRGAWLGNVVRMEELSR